MGTPIIDDLKDAIDVMIHPTNYGYKTMGIGEGIVKYYKVMLIPMILAIILSVVFMGSAAGVLGMAIGGIAAVAVFINYIIGIPIELLIGAFLVQLIAGNILKWFKGGFNATFAAYVFAIFPTLLIGWLSPVPILGLLLSIIAGIWGFIVLIFALAKLHNISAGKAFLGLLVTGLIIGIIIFIIALIIGVAFLGALLGSGALGAHAANYTTTAI